MSKILSKCAYYFCKIILKPLVKSALVYPSSTSAKLLARPFALNFYMQNMFTYTKDIDQFNKIDYWQSPEELFINNKGDCEDYSLFAKRLLLIRYPEAKVLAISVINKIDNLDLKAHAVCIYNKKINNMFGYIDNMGRHEEFYRESEVISNVIKEMYPEYELLNTYEIKR